MAHLSNPLATPQQLEAKLSHDPLPSELQDSIRFYTARLTQAAGVLLRLPQDIAAQAVVILYRYWLVENFLNFEFSVCNRLGQPQPLIIKLNPTPLSAIPYT